MMQGSRIQEFGSEVEDMLSNEISLDRFYSKMIQNISLSDKVNHNTLKDQEIDLLARIANPFGPEDKLKVSNLKSVAHKALFTAYQKFLFTNEFDRTHLLLRGLKVISDQQASSKLRNIIGFEVHRAHALGFYKEFKYMQAIKELHPVIGSCPKIGNSFINSLADTLVLLAECYSAVGRREDALHSAHLAESIAKQRVNKQKQHGEMIVDEYDEFEGPVLDSLQSQILTNCTLAAELERSGSKDSACDWYKRAYYVANKFKMEKSILQELLKLIDLSGAQIPIISASEYERENNDEDEFPSSIDRNDKSNSGRWFSPADNPMSTNEIAAPMTQAMQSQQLHQHKGEFGNKTRPQSALPRLVQHHRNGADAWNLFDDNVMANSGGYPVPNHHGDSNNRRRPENSSENGNFGIDIDAALRPKSAVSKLGGSYTNSNYPTPIANSTPITALATVGSIPNTPQSRNQTEKSSSSSSGLTNSPNVFQGHGKPLVRPNNNPAFSNANPKQIVEQALSNRPARPIPAIGNVGGHSVILLPSSPGSRKMSGSGSNTPSGSSKKNSNPAISSSGNKEAQGMQKSQGIAVGGALDSPSLPISSKNAYSQDMQESVSKPNSFEEEQTNNHTVNSTSQTVKRDVEPTQNVTSKLNKTQVSKALLFAQIQQQKDMEAPVNPAPKKSSSNNTALNTTAITNITANTDGKSKVRQQSNSPPRPNPLLEIDEFSREKLKRISYAFFPYFKGMKIEAKYQVTRLGDKGRWYPGRIVKADFTTGMYEVEFDNGDREKNIFVDNIRIPEYASKMALLHRGGKQSTTVANQKPADGNEKENAGKLPPARVIRKQNIDDMHTNMKKLLAGVNQRTDARKIERVTRKNSCIRKVQALVRGVLCRLRFPKIRHQLVKEISLLRKERELQALEAKVLAQHFLSQQLQDFLTQQIEEEEELLAEKAQQMAAAAVAELAQQRTEAEIQTGGSLVLSICAEDMEMMGDDAVVGVPQTSNAFQEEELNAIPEYEMNAPSEPPSRYISRPMPSNTEYYNNNFESPSYPMNEMYGSNTLLTPAPVDPAYLQYLQQYQDTLAASEYQHSVKFSTIEDALARVHNEQRGLINLEQERTQVFANQLESLKEALFAQQEEFKKLQEQEEMKRKLLEQQLQQLLESRIMAANATPSQPTHQKHAVPPEEERPSSMHSSTLSVRSHHEKPPLPTTNSVTAPHPIVVSTAPSTTNPSVDDPKSSSSFPPHLLLGSEDEVKMGGDMMENGGESFVLENGFQNLQIEEFWNSVTSTELPASLRPSMLMKSDFEMAGGESSVLQGPVPADSFTPMISPIPQQRATDLKKKSPPTTESLPNHPNPLEVKATTVGEGSSLRITTAEEEEEDEDVEVNGETLLETFPSVLQNESHLRPAPFSLTPQPPPPTASASFHEGSFTMNVGIEEFWGSTNSLYNELLPQESVDLTNHPNTTMQEPSKTPILSPVHSIAASEPSATKAITPHRDDAVERKTIASALARSFGKEFEETTVAEAIHRIANHPRSASPTAIEDAVQGEGSRDAVVEFVPLQGDDDESSVGDDIGEYGTIPAVLDQPSAVPEQFNEDDEEELEVASPLPVFHDTTLRTSATSLYPEQSGQESSGYSHLKDADRLEDYLNNNWPADLSALDHEEPYPYQDDLPVHQLNQLVMIEEDEELIVGNGPAGPTSLGSFRGSPTTLTGTNRIPSPHSSKLLESPHGSFTSMTGKSEVFDSNALFAMSLLGDDHEDEDDDDAEENENAGEEGEGDVLQTGFDEEEEGQEHTEESRELELRNLVLLPKNKAVNLYDTPPSPVMQRQASELSEKKYVKVVKDEDEDEDDEDEDEY